MIDSTVSPPYADRHATGGWLAQPSACGQSRATLLFLGILALSLFLHFFRFDQIGDANLYYTAAVKSMLQSWHNFFFVAAEPGGSVSVDKPPLGLWIEAASALLFGVNGFAVILPNILAGLASIALLYRWIGQQLGLGAGLLAALVVTVTPVTVATERNNTMDGLLTLVLLLAAWAFWRATRSGRARTLWLGALLIGLGFNVKMLQAFLPLPAFYALYLLGARAGWGRKVATLALATLLLLVVSLAWAVAVDLTPAAERPYVGGSENNSVLELIVGYNGLARLFGGQILARDGAPAQGALPGDDQRQRPDNFGPPGTDGPPAAGGQRPDGPGGASPFQSETGTAGWLRLWRAPLSKELSWLLPFALVSLALLLWRRPTWPLGQETLTALLWGGWLLTGLLFFSFASFFHAYYLTMLVPPLAVLVAAGAATLWRMRGKHPRRVTALLLFVVLLTAGYQVLNAAQFVDRLPWFFIVAALLLAGVALLRGQRPRLAWVTLLAALLLTPLLWSLWTVTVGSDRNLPGAYAGMETTGSLAGDRPPGENGTNEALLAYLEANTSAIRYLVAVPSSMQGASLVLATGRPVLYMGGFNGSDPVVSVTALEQMVAAGELRYVLQGGAPGDQQVIGRWLHNRCATVPALSTPALPAPQPGLRPPGGGNPPPGQAFPGGNGLTLYDCGTPLSGD